MALTLLNISLRSATTWANESFREQMIERFWLELPPREKTTVLRGPDIWCVPSPPFARP